MVIVAAAGLVAGAYVWLLPPAPSTSVTRVYSLTVEVGGYAFPHTSPAFWIVLALALAVPMALVIGMIAAIVWAVKAFRRRRTGQSV
jgi:hypothetical protein